MSGKRLRIKPLPEGCPAPDAASEYPIGYGKPPKHTRFRPGHSGNPKGRPKHQRNVETVLKEALGQRITIREGNRTYAVTKLHGIILTMINAALKGDAKAYSSLVALWRPLGMIRAAEQTREWNLQALTDDELDTLEKLVLKMENKNNQY